MTSPRKGVKRMETWEDAYRKRFGLCEGGKTCDCREEIKFIRGLLKKV